MTKLFSSSAVKTSAVRLGIAIFLAGAPMVLWGQAAGSAAAQKPGTPSEGAPSVESSWDSLLQGTIPQIKPDPALGPPPETTKTKSVDDFATHFFMELKADFWRYDTSFTGQPTLTGIVNGAPSNIFSAAGYPYPADFASDANRVESFLDFGTRGWGSDRINTHFALRYLQDATPVGLGNPAANVIETFPSSKRYEWQTATIEINSKPTDGAWAGTSLTIGRQYVYGSELAPIDGAAFTVDRPLYALTVFGGRRFSIFGAPDQRTMGGANVTFKVNPDTSVTYEGIWYIKGSHTVAVRHRFNQHWLLHSYLRIYGGTPVDFSAEGVYNSNKSGLHVSFFQKLSDKDYQYDFLEAARSDDSNVQLLRLYLGPLTPYSQFAINARRTITARFRLGASAAIRRLNDKNDATPFDSSFEDYRVNSQVFPMRKVETFFEYHQRNTDRLSPFGATTFDSLTGTGETSVKDLTGEIRRSFGEGRFSLNGGVYYRRVSMQDRFFYVDNLHQSGWLAGAWWKVDQHSRVFFDYNLDNDFFLLRPDLSNSRSLHVGVAWKY